MLTLCTFSVLTSIWSLWLVGKLQWEEYLVNSFWGIVGKVKAAVDYNIVLPKKTKRYYIVLAIKQLQGFCILRYWGEIRKNNIFIYEIKMPLMH